MAKDSGLFGAAVIATALIGVGAGAYYLSTKQKEGEKPTFDFNFQGIIDYITGLLKLPTGNGNGDGNGNGNGTPEPTPTPTPTPTGSTVIGAAGDWGSGRNSNWKKVADQMIKQKVKLVLGLGDYSYTSVGDWQKVVDYFKNAGIPMKGAEGNHDSSSYASTFGQSSFLTAVDSGPARIIMLNTESGGPSKNASFAEKELKATKQPWKIIIMHKPLYTSSSKHNAESSLASALQPILDKYGVQLVMYGHNHNYERIKLPNKNTMFVMAGTGGESHYNFSGQRQNVVYHNASDFGFAKISINGGTLTGQFITTSGAVKDSWTQNLATTSAKLAVQEEAMLARISI